VVRRLPSDRRYATFGHNFEFAGPGPGNDLYLHRRGHQPVFLSRCRDACIDPVYWRTRAVWIERGTIRVYDLARKHPHTLTVARPGSLPAYTLGTNRDVLVAAAGAGETTSVYAARR
jgi:hypothetical protein